MKAPINPVNEDEDDSTAMNEDDLGLIARYIDQSRRGMKAPINPVNEDEDDSTAMNEDDLGLIARYIDQSRRGMKAPINPVNEDEDDSTAMNEDDLGLIDELYRLTRSRRDLAAQPPRPEQLALIWRLGNSLPAHLSPDQRLGILIGEEVSLDPDTAKAVAEVRRQFPELPLCKHEYAQALNEALRWTTMRKLLQTTLDLHQDRVIRQLQFAETDAQATGRIAILRTARELELCRPDLLKSEASTLEDIQHADNRRNAYSEAREESLEALKRIVYKAKSVRKGTEVQPDQQAEGVPLPSDEVPYHIYMARLDGLGLCSDYGRAEFFREVLPKLDRKQRREFYKTSLKPGVGQNAYPALKVWVLDNKPVIQEFGWQWEELKTAAEKRGIEHPANMSKWASSVGLGNIVKRGWPSQAATQIRDSEPLLTAAPIFADALKA